ncbi:hypothetical protein ACMFMG_001078 [Clarireedia jacksonii]
MSPPFLKTLPREIRDLIYTYILASPDGSVALSPWSVDVARSLSILRTCKQIHRECKDIIWQHKGLALRNHVQLSRKFKVKQSISDRSGRKWSLFLNMEVLDWDELDWLCRGLQPIASTCAANPPTTITIKASKERPQTVEEFRDVIQLRENGEIVDGRLFQAYTTGSRSERASRLSSKWDMVVNTAWPQMSPWAKRKWLAEMLLDPADTTQLLFKLHSLFPGELYIDGVLFLKDKKQVVDCLRLDPRDGEIKILIEKCSPIVLLLPFTNIKSPKTQRGASLSTSRVAIKTSRAASASRMLHLLKDIPRELRDQIYEYAFQTTYSCVTFRSTVDGGFRILSYDPQNDFCPSDYSIPSIGLLSTCTQIYYEAQHILWKQNSLGLWPSDVFCNWIDLSERAFENVQHVEVNLDLTDVDDVKWAEKAFKRLSSWSVKGSLRRVTINPMREERMKLDVRWMQRVEEAIDMRRKNEQEPSGKSVVGQSLRLYGRWMTLLREAGGNEGYLGKDVETKVVITTCWDKWKREDQSSWLQKRRSGDAAQMEAVMADFNEAFGGELWANGELCYKDKQRIRRVFTLKPLLEPTSNGIY